MQGEIGGSPLITSRKFNLVTITRLPIVDPSAKNWKKKFNTVTETPIIRIKNRHRLLEPVIDISQVNQMKRGMIE